MSSLEAALQEARSSSVSMSFEDLIAPISDRRFFDDYWETAHLLVQRNQPSYYGALFGLDDIDRYLLAAQAGAGRQISVIPPPGSERKMVHRPAAEVKPELLYQRFSAGDTIRLLRLEEVWAPIQVLAARIEEDLSIRVRVNAYLTPASSQGFGVHFDYHDVFILQIAGSKTWDVYEPGPAFPLDADFARTTVPTVHDESLLQLREQARLETGDFLYVPRGFYHKAATTEDLSLHLTMSLHPVYWVDLMRRALEDLCKEHDALRRALPPGFLHRPEARQSMLQVFHELQRLVGEKASFDKALASIVRSEVSERRFPADGHFASLAELDRLTPQSWVERRAGLDCLIARSPTWASISFATNTVQGPAAIAPALELIRNRRRFRIEELPGGLDDNSKLALTRRLIREGLLKRVSEA